MPRSHPRIIIVGAGFGGLYAARVFKHAGVDVTVVDRTNHHVFQPLLYQVATATLAPSDIGAPIRWLLRRQKNTTVLMAEVRAVNPDAKVVVLDDGRQLPYDYLIVAAGARHSYFSHPEWEPVAPGLKSIDDAIELRRRWLLAFERAEFTDDPAERAAYLTFAIIGGGPTGVELAGMLPTISRYALPEDFRRIDTRSARVVLIEGGPRLLPAFPEALSTEAARELGELGVEIKLRSLVTRVTPEGVEIGAERIRARTIFWAAGNTASSLGTSLGAKLDRSGRVHVADDLSVPEHPEIYIVGDLAVMTTNGKPVPGVAPAAMQSGRTAAKNILRTIAGEPRRAFRYRNKGDLATIGRYRAVGLIGDTQLAGATAWWFWLLVHITYLAGFRNRASVLIEWAYSFFTYERGARLITGTRREPVASQPPIPPRW